MTSQPPKSIPEQRADAVFKIVAATGFLLNTFDHLDFLSGGQQRVFSAGLRHSANRFRVELEIAEKSITQLDPNNPQLMQQLADSYEVLDNFLQLMLKAGRILTPQSMELMNKDVIETARRWGVDIEQP